jgi:hypothetical protein
MNTNEQIKTRIQSIKGVVDVFFTPDSKVSDIALMSKWKEDEIEKRAEDIRRINGIRSVEYFILKSSFL